MRYNKNLKKILNLNINDYKEYSEKYSSIEIEIKPVNNKSGKFINIEEEDEKYYHIYFNNNKEEIKRNYINKDEIKIIKIIIDYKIESLENLFLYCKCIESINFKKFYRKNVTYMRDMFYWCFSLKELNLNNFITNNVIDMRYMFYCCFSLEELNFSKFNTNKVSNMSYMFYGCSSLKELNLSNFKTDNANNISFIFQGCSKKLIMKIKTLYKNIKEEAFINFEYF